MSYQLQIIVTPRNLSHGILFASYGFLHVNLSRLYPHVSLLKSDLCGSNDHNIVNYGTLLNVEKKGFLIIALMHVGPLFVQVVFYLLLLFCLW